MKLSEKIRYGYLKEALEEIQTLFENTHLYEDYVMQSAIFYRTERDLGNGVMTARDANLNKNRITQALWNNSIPSLKYGT